jgi:DNA-binding transcriptional regulator YiaG
MGKMESLLKEQIVRLARRQVRGMVVPLARDVRALKRTVRQMRPGLAMATKVAAEYQRQVDTERGRLEVPPEEVRTARLSAGRIAGLRKRLGLTQAGMATLMGVSTGAVALWERGSSSPKGANRAAIVALRKLKRSEVKRLLMVKRQEAQRQAPRRRARRAARGRRGRKRG